MIDAVGSVAILLGGAVVAFWAGVMAWLVGVGGGLEEAGQSLWAGASLAVLWAFFVVGVLL